MTALPELLDLVDLATTRGDGVLPPSMTKRHADVARRLRTRSGFVGDSLVVAVAGGTGCGKSSIVNALVGAPVVTTGIVRPTTDRATAVMSPDPHLDLGPLLDQLEVGDRVTHPGLGPMVLIDLPDFDSTVRRHREVVESLVPQVDAVIWVLDPEKYADPLLHDGFLAGLAQHAAQFVFALNQVDRLGETTATVVAALHAMLETDGLASSAVVPTVADPSVGVDIEALDAELVRRWDVKATALRAIALQLRQIASEGWREAGSPPSGADPDGAALARATFVSLGVAAYDLHHRLRPGEA